MSYLINAPVSIEYVDFNHVNDDIPRYGDNFNYNGEKSNWCAYMHINKVNNKKYIGISSDLHKRWCGNGTAYKGSTRFWDSIKSHGWDNFQHIVLMNGLTATMASELEKYLIKQFDTYYLNNKGYNMTLGGLEGNTRKTGTAIYQYDLNGIFIQQFDSISEANNVCGDYVKDCKGRINDAINDEHPFAYGFLWSKEYHDRIDSYYPNDKRYTDEYHFPTEYTSYGRIVQLTKGGELIKIHSSLCAISQDQHIIRTILKCCKGESKTYNNNIWMFENDYSQDNLDTILSNVNATRVIRTGGVVAYDLDGNYLSEYKTILLASAYLKVDSSIISKACKGIVGHVQNYQFRYIGEPSPGKYVPKQKTYPLKVPYKIAKIDIDTLEVLKIYNNYVEIHDDFNLNCSGCVVKKCLEGKQKTCLGYIWRYIDNEYNIIDPSNL